VCLLAVFGSQAVAQQQFDGLCSEIKIEILQELTLERVGFLATLEVTNNATDDPITSFSAELTFIDPDLPAGQQDVSDQFFVKPPELRSINNIDGAGIIPPTQTAIVEWFIIPKISAGGTNPLGERYTIGANLAGRIYGSEIPADVLAVNPDQITVKPEPQLDITYFQPRDVQGDDPFTPEVEAPVPFVLGVLVKNSGFGPANKLKIKSQQPRIVENERQLILVAQLLGARINDDPLRDAELTVDIGDIPPGTARKGAWDMITSLSGTFVEFKASYTHDTELGGEDTSLINSLEAHFIAAEVKDDRPGTDDIKDFLADTDRDPDQIPDALYGTNGEIYPVNMLLSPTVQLAGGARSHIQASIDVYANYEDWVYMRVDDPQQAKYPIARVTRSDGKVLNPNNYWTNIRYRKTDNRRLTYLNILDFVEVGQYSYNVEYGHVSNDGLPPETRLRFAGQVEIGNDGRYYILPETQIYFTVEDDSIASTQYSLDGGSFRPALPFNITAGGEHVLEYFSVDEFGNAEPHLFASVVVAGGIPDVASFDSDHDEIFVRGQALSARPSQFNFQFRGRENAPGLDAAIDIYSGVLAMATIGGIPSSPTRATDALLVPGGENVDFYKYRLDAGAWSAEVAVSESIALSDLGSGAHTVDVIGRNANGDYPDDADAASATWTIDPAAAQTTVSGPAMPSAADSLSLTVGGDTVTEYRYRLNDSFFHAQVPVSQPIELAALPPGVHTLDVIGLIDGEWQSEDMPTRIMLTIDPEYGLDFEDLALVRHEDFDDIGESLTYFDWDGRNQDGTILAPGWYTVKLSITDSLGKSTGRVRLVQVGDMLPDRAPISAEISSVERHPHAAGGVLVWQDQRSGDWDIYSRNVFADGSLDGEQRLSSSALNQENPKTDGEWVVWQDRQPDGSWDIVAVDLENPGTPVTVTTTPSTDEINPSIDWPWVVYQKRAAGADNNVPWQLEAFNLDTSTPMVVDATAQHQLDPSVDEHRVVWQDWRDAGPGEIYMKDLRSGAVTRITSDSGAQHHPVIDRHWIVWGDTRSGAQNDLYGFNLKRGAEIQLTDTPEDEVRPCINGEWVVYTEDSSGPLTNNIRMLSFASLSQLQLTNGPSAKDRACMTSGHIIWEDGARVLSGALPNVQPVYNNRTPVVVTPEMVAYQQDAFTLLSVWNRDGSVSEVTRYVTLGPNPVTETATWNGSAAVGDNFPLQAGDFLWIRFRARNVLDLGGGGKDPVDLVAGSNILSACFFPDKYTSYRLVESLGVANVNTAHILDSASGKWQATSVVNGNIIGDNFPIPRVAVVMLDLKNPVTNWIPDGGGAGRSQDSN
jgi:beta propeller repeat protein